MYSNLASLISFVVLVVVTTPVSAEETSPNILFCIADDWGWPNAGAYGDEVIPTPTFDRLAREGVLFENAFVTSPSCTPSRNSILTGQYHWRLEEGANLWSTLHPKFPVYPLLLQDAGYFIGHWRKAWGPGNWRFLGREDDPAGPNFESFEEFLESRSADTPFCFWLGSSDPHRPYLWRSGVTNGIDTRAIKPPADLPNHEIVRHDVADYYYEVQRFDSDVAAAIKTLEKSGELDSTIIVMTGDHGMPFPRHKTQLYDSGTHVCLAIRWGNRIAAGQRVTDFVSLSDLAPTFLEAAGAEVPEQMTGRSLVPILASQTSGRVDARRDHVLTGRERHTPAQVSPNTNGYPMRALRTDKYLYIRNFAPDRWPAGAGPEFRDCDDSPTKTFLLEQRDKPTVRTYFELAFDRRGGEELYDLEKDPHQLQNVADQEKYRTVKESLASRLTDELRVSGDPRIVGNGENFDEYEYRPEFSWTNLFNRKDTSGWWNPYDWGEVKVADGVVELTGSKKFFLVTTKRYYDFVFEGEVQIPAGAANSGFMFRCHVEPNRVYGYQAEVDGSDRRWSGGLYDEGRRQWIWPSQRGRTTVPELLEYEEVSHEFFRKPEVAGALNRDGWNKYRITCRDDQIRIEVNSVVTTDIRDDTDASGYIGIQHHGERGKTYRFRNLRIREL